MSDTDGATDAKTCFLISPIGEEGSEVRKHADIVRRYIVEPVLQDDYGFRVKRADDEAAPGMITVDVINSVLDSDLAIADLTFTNPNVFYEIGIRHMASLPTIHMVEQRTILPFDNAQYRAIKFDMDSVPGHDAAKKDLSNAVAAVLTDGYEISNPVVHARGAATRAAEIDRLAESADETDRLVAALSKRIDDQEVRISQQGHMIDELLADQDADMPGQADFRKAYRRMPSALVHPDWQMPEGELTDLERQQITKMIHELGNQLKTKYGRTRPRTPEKPDDDPEQSDP